MVIDDLVKQIELDFIEFSAGDNAENELPLKKREQIIALIWNLLKSDKWKQKISYNDYQKILDVWINRLMAQTYETELVRWILANRMTTFLESDISKESKENILHRLGYSTRIL